MHHNICPYFKRRTNIQLNFTHDFSHMPECQSAKFVLFVSKNVFFLVILRKCCLFLLMCSSNSPQFQCYRRHSVRRNAQTSASRVGGDIDIPPDIAGICTYFRLNARADAWSNRPDACTFYRNDRNDILSKKTIKARKNWSFQQKSACTDWLYELA